MENNIENAPFGSYQRTAVTSRFLIKKTEKISAAIHLVTEHFPPDDPLRMMLRRRSLELIDEVFKCERRSVSMQNTLDTVELILTCLEVARMAKLISDTNFSILSKETHAVKNAYGRDARVLNEDFFNDTKEGAPLGQSNETQSYKGHEFRHDKMSYKSIGVSDKSDSVRNHMIIKSATDKSDKDKVSIRRNVILSIIKKIGKIGIKDITPEISDCSEKTIQRELVQMVEDGVIVREGDRRWSRYALNTK
ncbi:MAG: hypothetical protein A3D48_04245 [Candidatus Yanofskybacteria bacterium RIFCSPHIGHO2_02_FULL_43_17]|uniref:HTH deoR-type domain-containing protein n=1 Tax=Candidatus Taylorbacteria bacterium RIFCSPLOWO2_01_FULL_45_15b TaxID=1802319 RepID=A0A1G2NCN7_9BACT|nr:MAG: hypothetical protein A3D48_04245 [Candidatus Yanofskybacteria bacterium RIFCSPHIGHO2_02_FULL_43_17]OHA33868.1 MAG: hypothetical protein A2928_00045 [Candidatus Taylorbacteria bacterium RIFCSPLOWO2_01_FULL_45_15b]